MILRLGSFGGFGPRLFTFFPPLSTTLDTGPYALLAPLSLWQSRLASTLATHFDLLNGSLVLYNHCLADLTQRKAYLVMIDFLSSKLTDSLLA